MLSTNAGKRGNAIPPITEPGFTYTGTFNVTEDAEYRILRLLTSGTLTLDRSMNLDIFLVGGGGGGSTVQNGNGAGGGYTKTFKQSTDGWTDGLAPYVVSGIGEIVTIGAGGAASTGSGGGTGGFTQFRDATYRANGGTGALHTTGGPAGNGGSGGGQLNNSGGSDGSDGLPFTGNVRGIGQGHTTRAFGELTGQLYAGGGGGASNNAANAPGEGGAGGGGRGGVTTSQGTAGQANTGGGAGGGSSGTPVAGGSGIVLVRWRKSA